MSKAIERLKADEGKNLKGHMVKTKGKESILHIGIGYNLENASAERDLLDAGVLPKDLASVMKVNGMALTDKQADALFDISYQQATSRAQGFSPNFRKLPQEMQETLINMSFQLGNRLNDFKDMRAALEEGDYDAVKKEMIDSDWAKQTPDRAKRLVKTLSDLRTPAVASVQQEKIDAKDYMAQQMEDRMVDELYETMKEEDEIGELAKWLDAKEVAEEQAPDPAPEKDKQTAAPARKVQRLEQGLFEDDDGQKFVVDDKNRMFQLDETGKPTQLIDPTTMDFSGLEEASNG